MVWALLLMLAGCYAERAVVVHESSDPADADYREVLDRARARRDAAPPIERLRDAIERYREDRGVYPSDLMDLVEQDYLVRIPQPPQDMVYRYRPSLGVVEMVSTRTIADHDTELTPDPLSLPE